MLKLSVTVLLVSFVFSPLAKSQEQKVSELDGTWRFHSYSCKTGAKMALIEEGDFATYSFDAVKGKATIRQGYENGKCLTVIEFKISVENQMVRWSSGKILSSSCEVDTDITETPTPFRMTKLPTGENAIAIDASPGEICTQNGVGEIYLTRIPIG